MIVFAISSLGKGVAFEDFIVILRYKDMGLSKTAAFGTRENRIASYAKALAHPARVAILDFLSNQDACICGDIVDQIPLSQSTVSQHLSELKRAGLIQGEIEGPRVCYCINRKAWNEARELLSGVFQEVKNSC
jgi:ArsR family transcriptional regulator